MEIEQKEPTQPPARELSARDNLPFSAALVVDHKPISPNCLGSCQSSRMAALPSLPPYSPASESWDSYMIRFECFLEAHGLTGISDDRKRAFFLSYCGPEVFETARALLAPAAVQTVPWDTLQKELRTHYAPELTRLARRYAFYHRDQAKGESIHRYVAALRKAALYCEFADFDEVLLSRVVGGVRDLELQRRLLAMPNLTLQMAIEEAQAAEMLY